MFTCWKNNYTKAYSQHIDPPANPMVREFISAFANLNGAKNTITFHFLNGACYYFAIILSHRFASQKPTIWYDTANNHFLTEINQVLYDISGPIYPNISDFSNYYIWQDYQRFDPIHAERIIRDCINYGGFNNE